MSASPRLAPDCTFPLWPPGGTPSQPICKPAAKGKEAEKSVFTNLIYQSFKKKKNLYWIICSDAPRLGNRDTVRSLTSVS